MRNERPRDLKKAVALFEEFENSDDYPTKAKCFQEAIALIDLFSEQNPDPQHAEYVENIRLLYTRKFLEQLGICDNMGPDDWLKYFVIMIKRNEVLDIISKQPYFEEHLARFLRLWSITDEQGNEREITLPAFLDGIRNTATDEG